jgi:hypothetical protein
MVFLGSNEDTISKTEVQQLEILAIHKPKVVKSYDIIENTQSTKTPKINIMQKAKIEKLINSVQFLAKFFGCDIFKWRLNATLTTTLETIIPTIEPVHFALTKEELSGRFYLSLNLFEQISSPFSEVRRH